MADTIGRITVPEPTASGLTFPLVSDYGFAMSRSAPVIEHRFGSGATLSVQRFSTTLGPRRFHFRCGAMSYTQRQSLLDFYNNVQGSFQTFTYNVPNADRTTTTPTTVYFETTPISITHLANMCRTELVFIEYFDSATAPTYTVNSTGVRFPSSGLLTDLSSQVQTLIPLIHIKVRDSSVPDIYLSDRRCTVGSTTYLPRVLALGEDGSDVIMSQSAQDMQSSSDSVRFTFGNADRVMSALVQDAGLKFASIDLTLARVRSNGTSVDILQLWKGLILSWTNDGTAIFPVTCSDGLYPTTQNYPRRTVTRQCWKTFNDGVNCPYTAYGSGGSAISCDYFFDSTNGCLAHNMSPYFGGQSAFPQSVIIKDDATGLWGLNIKPFWVTSTSIVSDSIWDKPLPEIWCNDGGNPLYAYWANAIVSAVRDESTFEDVLGIIGVGPIGAYEGMSVQTTPDGYKVLICPLADGFPPQGFKVDSQLRVTSYHPDMGLREVLGTDPTNPISDTFSLGQGTPQVWWVNDPPWGAIYPQAAGTAFVEMRYQKSAGSGIAPTTAESHSMSVPIARGLNGYSFAVDGTRSTVYGMVNPFWIAVNTYLRALGLDQADAATQVGMIVLPSVFAGDGTGTAEIADSWVIPVLGSGPSIYDVTASGQALNGVVNTITNTFDYWTLDDQYTSTQNSISIADALTAGYIVADSTSGNERQFQFQGTISEFKPFRDWLREILACSLGYFSFEFGKLKLGIRYSAVPTGAFTVANMLYQSLSLSPMESAFEYLKIDFANVALQYQQDMVEYQDKDHAAYYGRAGAPLTARQRIVGLSSISQGLRLAVTRVREEIGGILRDDLSNPYVEFDNANTATWRTTVLALDTYVGQVVSVTHPDVPTYPGAVGQSPDPDHTWRFRITRWTLHKDWSITISGRSVTDSMYDLDVGPPPVEVLPTPPPVLFYSEPLGQWAPSQVQSPLLFADALYPREFTFDLAQSYTTGEDGKPLAQAIVSGKLPINKFIPGCGAPDVKHGTISQATTGGYIVGGKTYRIQVCAGNVYNAHSAPSDILIVQVPSGTDTNTITLSGIKWPAIDGLSQARVFASDIDDLIGLQGTYALTGDHTGYTPTSITITGPFTRSDYAVPNAAISALRVQSQFVVHGGVLGATVDHVSANTIVSGDTIDLSGTPDNWAGRVLAIIGREPSSGPSSAPYVTYHINSFDHTTGTFTLSVDPTGTVLPGDVFVVCFLGYDNSSAPTVITDAAISNTTNSHAGYTTNDPKLVGNSVRVIAGLSRGLSAKIVSNTPTSVTLDSPLPLDSTSVYIMVEQTWDNATAAPISNADPLAVTQLALDISNYHWVTILVEGLTADADNNFVDEMDAPVRMMFVFGAQGTRTITGNADMLATDSLVNAIITAPATYTSLYFSLVPNQTFTVQNDLTSTVSLTIQLQTGDSFEDGSTSAVLVVGDSLTWRVHGNG